MAARYSAWLRFGIAATLLVGCSDPRPTTTQQLGALLRESPNDPEIRFLCSNYASLEDLEDLAREHPDPIHVVAVVDRLARKVWDSGPEPHELEPRLRQWCEAWSTLDPENGYPLVVLADLAMNRGRLGEALELADRASRAERLDDYSREAQRRAHATLLHHELRDVALLYEISQPLQRAPAKLMWVGLMVQAHGHEALRRGSEQEAEDSFRCVARLGDLVLGSSSDSYPMAIVGLLRRFAYKGLCKLALLRGEHEDALSFIELGNESARMQEWIDRATERASSADAWATSHNGLYFLPFPIDERLEGPHGLLSRSNWPDRFTQEERRVLERLHRRMRNRPDAVRESVVNRMEHGERVTFSAYLTEEDRLAIDRTECDLDALVEHAGTLYPERYEAALHRKPLVELATPRPAEDADRLTYRQTLLRDEALLALVRFDDAGALEELPAPEGYDDENLELAAAHLALGNGGEDTSELVETLLLWSSYPSVGTALRYLARDGLEPLFPLMEQAWLDADWNCLIAGCNLLRETTGEDHDMDVGAWLAWADEQGYR